MKNFLRLLWSTVFLYSALAGAENALERVRSPVDFVADDLEGGRHAAVEPGRKATVWVFISHDCPVCNAYAPELGRLRVAYTARGIAINVVYAEPGLSRETIRQHADAYGYRGRVFHDDELRLAKACGVAVTPEVAVIGPDGSVAYRGRIDDRFLGPGRERGFTGTADLRLALEALLAGQPVPVPRTNAVGCALEFP